MKVVYAQDGYQDTVTKSIFLAGPSPRNGYGDSWRDEALSILMDLGYDGTVFVPVPSNGQFPDDYLKQVEWEKKWLDAVDIIAFWIPRDLNSLPGFTTNIEIGRYIDQGRCVVGFPKDAPKTRYIEWLVKDATNTAVYHSLLDVIQKSLTDINDGALRKGGDIYIPLKIWNHPAFMSWCKKGKIIDGHGFLTDILRCNIFWNDGHNFGVEIWGKIYPNRGVNDVIKINFLSTSSDTVLIHKCGDKKDDDNT